MITPQTLKALEKIHSFYRDFNQQENQSDRFMAANGHPHARQYKALRRFFDSLKYSSNSRARYFSFVNAGNHSAYRAPGLKVDHGPVGFGNFRHVFPADPQRWGAYLTKCAEEDWPEVVGPEINTGEWIIHTTDEGLVKELLQVTVCMKAQYESPVMVVTIANPDMRTFGKVYRILKRYHTGHILPRRTQADDYEDTKPLPLWEKKFSFGRVDRVTVTERAVLVPLTRLGRKGHRMLMRNVEDLMFLIKRGFPWEQCRTYFRESLDTRSYLLLEGLFEARTTRSVPETVVVEVGSAV